MKFIYYTNGSIYLLTILGYFTIYLGMLMQMVLGLSQVLFFLILLLNFNKFSKQIKKHLMTYGILTGLLLLLFFFGDPFVRTLDRTVSIVLVFFLPMVIGTYFTYIVYQLNQKVL